MDDPADLFDKRSGCDVDTSIPALGPGATGWVDANAFLVDPTGHELEATPTLCAAPGLEGTCINKESPGLNA